MSNYDTFDDLNTPIVIDNGSGSLKVGIAGRERPQNSIPSCVGDPKHKRVILQAPRAEKYYGHDAMKYRGLCQLSYPMQHGVVENWNDMTQLWQHAYRDVLNAKTEEHPVLLTEPALNPIKNRVRTAQIFFDQFNVPALYFAPPPVLALYASGRLTGCVLDCGHGVTSCIPICEGFALPHAITRMDVAGDDVNKYFQRELRQVGVVFHASSEIETVRIIKETECELSIKSLKSLDERNVTTTKTKKDEEEQSVKYVLPDGSSLEIGNARTRAPEILFDPSLIGLEYRGIHYCVLEAIQKSDLDLRRDLYQRIVLSGGSTMTKNFGKRLVSELQTAVSQQARIKIYAPHERELTTWIGGSLLSFLESFREMWIRKKEFNDLGSSILYRKSFF